MLTALVAALALVFLVLSIFQSAALWLGSQPGGAFDLSSEAAPRRLLMAVRAARQVALVSAALAFEEIFDELAFRAPIFWALVVSLVLFTVILDQLVARTLALFDPPRAYRMTRPAARVLASPLLPPSRLVLALGRVIGRAASRSARSRGIDSAHEALLAPEGGAAGSDPDAATDATREAEGELIENVVEFTGTLVREVMTPRTEMISIEEGSNLAELVELAVRTNRSRIVVTRGSVDRIAGMVHVKDLLDLWSDPPRDRGVSAITRPVMSIPESKKGVELLREMQARGAQLAVVVDEHGGTAGLVTIEDLVEELVGEISDEHEVMKPALLVKPDGSALVRGSYPVFDLGARFDVEFPEVEADTVGGFVIALLGRLPEAGDTVLSAGLRLEVVEADRRRVRRVRVTRAAGPVPGAGAASVPNAARDAVDASGTTRESQ